MLQIASKIYAFLLFPNSLLVCNKSYEIFYILKEADWMLFQASANNFCYVLTIFWYIPWKYKYWYI